MHCSSLVNHLVWMIVYKEKKKEKVRVEDEKRGVSFIFITPLFLFLIWMPRTKEFGGFFFASRAKVGARRSKGNGGHVVQLRLQCTRDYINKWPWFKFLFSFPLFLSCIIHPSIHPPHLIHLSPILCVLYHGMGCRSVAKPLSSSDARSARSTAFVFMFAFIVIIRFSSSIAPPVHSSTAKDKHKRWDEAMSSTKNDDDRGSGKIINHPLERRTAYWKERINPILHPRVSARWEIPLVCLFFFFYSLDSLPSSSFSTALNSLSPFFLLLLLLFLLSCINIYQHGIHRRCSPQVCTAAAFKHHLSNE